MLLNRKRAEEIMEKYGVKAIIASSPENVTYISDYWDLEHWTIKGGNQVYAVLPLDKNIEPFIVTSVGSLDQAAIQKNCWIDNFYTYGIFFTTIPEVSLLSETEQELKKFLENMKESEDPASALVSGLAERGLTGERIALDEMNIMPQLFDKIQRKLSNTEIIYGDSLMKELRAVKSEEEVKRLKRSAEITEKAFLTAIQEIHEGISELEIYNIVKRNIIEEGGIPTLSAIGAAQNSVFVNVIPSEYKIKKNDIIRFDIGCSYKYYFSDTARIAVLGEPSEKLKTYYNAIKEGEERALKLVKPGTKASDIFKEAIKSIREAGIPYYNRNHVGHGIGIEFYDIPRITPLSNDILEEGMVLNIETPYYEMGFGGVQVEDTVHVTKNGYMELTKISRDLFIL